MMATDLQQLYNRAWIFAATAHIGQKMKSSELPYAVHVAMVANELVFADRVEPVGDLEQAIPAALLHDVLEDTSVTHNELEAIFGFKVAGIVARLSKNLVSPFTHERYLSEIADHSPEACAIKLCDRITNLQSAPASWAKEKRESYLAESVQILDLLGGSHSYLRQRLSEAIARYSDLYVRAAT